MRCSCQVCGTYMVHSESFGLGCVCPACGQRCKQCLGTDTVVSKDALKEAAKNMSFEAISFTKPEEDNLCGRESYEDAYGD